MGMPHVLASVMLWGCLCSAAAAAENAHGFDCDNPRYTDERNVCASEATIAADAELNRVYAQARSSLHEALAAMDCSGCEKAEQQLVAAQRAWIKLRDQDCAAAIAVISGSSRNYAEQHCLTTHARDRTRQLRDFYELL